MSWLFPSGSQNYWSFSFIISSSNECSGLISFRIDWFYLLAVQGTLKSLLQHHRSTASILRCSAFIMVQQSHPYMTTGKTIALTRWTFAGKVMSLLTGCWVVARGLGCSAACGILVTQAGIEHASPALQDIILNHWTTREVPLYPSWTRALSLGEAHSKNPPGVFRLSRVLHVLWGLRGRERFTEELKVSLWIPVTYQWRQV